MKCLSRYILNLMHEHVPFTWKTKVKATLSWLNHACVVAIDAKHAAEGTPQYTSKASECQGILKQKHQVYLAKVKEEMSKHPRGSKRWWNIVKQLMRKKTSSYLFPPLKSSAGI